MNPARSTFIGGPHPRAVTVRFEPHSKGEVFTWDKIGGNGKAETFSIILYLDGKRRDFNSPSCAGTGFQSSRRLDNQAVEIVLECEKMSKVRFIRRLSRNSSDLIIDITDDLPEGRRFERHLILEKQSSIKR
jgi:hypothetical protein